MLSRVGEIHETRRGLPGDPDPSQSRYIEAAVNGILIGGLYMPNGNPRPGPKFEYKMAWFEKLIEHAAGLLESGLPVMLAGDFNVMPTERDVYKPERWTADERHGQHAICPLGTCYHAPAPKPGHHMLGLLRNLARFVRLRASNVLIEKRASILPIFAGAIIPLVFATGMSVDYAHAMRTQTRLQTAADAAAIAAVSKQVMSLANSYGLPAAYSPIIGQQAATTVFAATANKLIANNEIQLNMNDPTQFDIVIVDNLDHTSRTATVTFRGQSPNAFAKILQVATLTVKGAATSTVSAGLYTDMYVVLDTSQSMGLAATDNDASLLWNGVIKYNGAGCQFGCHVPAPGQNYANDWVAKQVGASLRIDVLRQATTDMVQTAMDTEGSNSLYRFGLYRIGQTTSDISPLNANLSQIKSDVSSLTLGPNDSGGTGDTNLTDMSNYVYPKIMSHSDGSTSQKSRAFLFIITDGVFDTKGNCTYGHCTGPIDPQTCKQYKDNNVTVAVLYTTYLPVKSNPLDPNSTSLRDEYIQLVQPFANNIAPQLQACASPGWYYEASDGPTIHAAMQRIFAQAIQSPILTQ